MKILWLDRLISTLDTQSWGIGKWSHPAGSHPLPAGPKRWPPPVCFLLWSQGLTQGLSDHSVKFCTWKVMCCVLVKTMISTRRPPQTLRLAEFGLLLQEYCEGGNWLLVSLADRTIEPCSAPAISHRATRGQCVAAYGKHTARRCN